MERERTHTRERKNETHAVIAKEREGAKETETAIKRERETEREKERERKMGCVVHACNIDACVYAHRDSNRHFASQNIESAKESDGKREVIH